MGKVEKKIESEIEPAVETIVEKKIDKKTTLATIKKLLEEKKIEPVSVIELNNGFKISLKFYKEKAIASKWLTFKGFKVKESIHNIIIASKGE